mmetsp:Transcript_32535/g.89109  ORF Transcript_32535/g.89109 Transcript_32535/m.89109 type:complete len:256 (+) Transcript_32535:45-812(+)
MFHRNCLNAVSHLINASPIVWGQITLFATLPLDGNGSAFDTLDGLDFINNAGFPFACVLCLYYFLCDRAVGAVLTVWVAIMLVAAVVFTVSVGTSTARVTAAIVCGVCSFLQTITHGAEPYVPPNASGTKQWVRTKDHLNKHMGPGRALLTFVTLCMGIFMEFYASPRLLAVQLVILASKCGITPNWWLDIQDLITAAKAESYAPIHRLPRMHEMAPVYELEQFKRASQSYTSLRSRRTEWRRSSIREATVPDEQ